MTTIETEHYTVNATAEAIDTFLSDMQNIEQLLPKDKISDWTADEQSCSFKVQGAATVSLIHKGGDRGAKIHYVSGEKSPFPFELDVYIDRKDEQSDVFLKFEGELNAFLKMMAVKPLTNLFNGMGKRLQEVHA